MLGFFRDLRHDLRCSIACSRDMTRAVRAFRSGRLPEAHTALGAVLAAEPPAKFAALRTHRGTVNLLAVTLRAEVAAKLGDDASTRASIEQGLALWEETRRARRVSEKSQESFAAWEQWAKGWLASHPPPAP